MISLCLLILSDLIGEYVSEFDVLINQYEVFDTNDDIDLIEWRFNVPIRCLKFLRLTRLLYHRHYTWIFSIA